MKNYTEWNKRVFPRLLQNLPKRLQLDLKCIDFDYSKETGMSLSTEAVNGVFLHGDTGTGKTVWAAQTALQWSFHRYMKDKETEFMFIVCPALFYQLREQFSKTERDHEFIPYLCNVPLLILDDIAVDKLTPYVYQMLYLIINTRYDSMLPTIFTSNVNLLDLEKMFGDSRITSRINRSCNILKKEHYDKK